MALGALQHVVTKGYREHVLLSSAKPQNTVQNKWHLDYSHTKRTHNEEILKNNSCC